MRIKTLVLLFSLMLISVVSSYSQGETIDISTLKPTSNYSRVAIKSNLLYDAILVPNIGVELNFFRNWSIYGDLMYAGWEIPVKHYYWDLYGAQAGIRKYFGNKFQQRRMTGHHAGIYGQALAYDLQAGNIGQQTPSINVGVGVEYGYSFPVSHNINIDLELGFGYLGGKYDEYDVTDEHNTWRGTIQRNWVGPTKASVSLVWLFRDVNQEARIKAKQIREEKKKTNEKEREAVKRAKEKQQLDKKKEREATKRAEQEAQTKKAAEEKSQMSAANEENDGTANRKAGKKDRKALKGDKENREPEKKQKDKIGEGKV